MFNRVHELPTALSRACTCVNCNDDNTVVLAVTNASPDDLDMSDEKRNSQQCTNTETPPHTLPDVAESKDIITEPLPKASTLHRLPSTKPPDMPPPAPHTLPRVRDKDLVSEPFGVKPYAVVDLEKVRNFTCDLCECWP